MGLYGDKKDYEELVKENIAKAKILISIPEENRPAAIELLNEREQILTENSIWVNFKLKRIDKKIEKLKKIATKENP